MMYSMDVKSQFSIAEIMYSMDVQKLVQYSGDDVFGGC